MRDERRTTTTAELQAALVEARKKEQEAFRLWREADREANDIRDHLLAALLESTR